MCQSLHNVYLKVTFLVENAIFEESTLLKLLAGKDLPVTFVLKSKYGSKGSPTNVSNHGVGFATIPVRTMVVLVCRSRQQIWIGVVFYTMSKGIERGLANGQDHRPNER